MDQLGLGKEQWSYNTPEAQHGMQHWILTNIYEPESEKK